MLANRVRELTSTTGTGDIALAGALPGHIGFSDAFTIGDSVIYVIEDGDNYEIGTGTLVDALTLERTDVAETLVGGTYLQAGAAPIDLSGNARVYCAATADFLLSPTHDADIIREVTPDAGVTADGVLLKDGAVTASKLTSGSAALGEASPDAEHIVLGGTLENNAGLSVLSNPANGRGILYFTDGASYQNQGGLIYSHQYDRLAVVAGQTEVLHAYGTDIQARTQLSIQWGVASATISKTTGNHSGPKLVIHNEDDTDGNLSSLQFTSSGASETFKSATAGIYAQHVGRNATYPYGDLLFHTTDSGGNHNRVFKLGFDQSAVFSGSLSAVSGHFDGNISLAGSPDQYVGLLQDQDINLTLGSVAGTDARIYLYGTGNGQANAGDIDIRTSGNAGLVTVGGDFSVLGAVTSGSSLSLGTTLHVNGTATFASAVFAEANAHVGYRSDGQESLLNIGRQAHDNGGQSTLQFFAHDGTFGNGFKVRYVKDAGADELRFIDGGDKSILTLANIGETATFAGDVSIASDNLDLGDNTDTGAVQKFHADRVGVNQNIMSLEGWWNGTRVAAVAAQSGTDTVGKASGELIFTTAPDDATGIVTRLRIDERGRFHFHGNELTGLASMHSNVDTSNVNIAGGSSFNSGANLYLYGPGHASQASDILFKVDTTNTLLYDNSNAEWNFAGNKIVRVGPGNDVSMRIGADSTGGGITDATIKVGRVGVPHYLNAEEPVGVWSVVSDGTENQLRLGGATSLMNAPTEISFWTAPDATTVTGSQQWKISNDGSLVSFDGTVIRRATDTGSLRISGGTSTGIGANFVLYGESHATNANDMIFRAGASPWLSWDDSAGVATCDGNLATDTAKRLRVGGVPRSDWSMSYDVIEVGETGAMMAATTATSGDAVWLGGNWYFDGAYKYRSNGHAAQLYINNAGDTIVRTAANNASGPGGELVWDDVLTVYASGNVGLGGGDLLDTGSGTFSGNITLTGSDSSILCSVNTSTMTLSGGISGAQGGAILLYGNAEATKANDIAFLAAGSTKLNWDNSIGYWNFQGNNLSGIGNVSISGTGMYNADDVSNWTLSGGVNTASGSNITLYGGGHASQASDIVFRDGASYVLNYDARAGLWDFQGNYLQSVGDIRMIGDSIYRLADSEQLNISGGSSVAAGANFLMFGGAHATTPNDFYVRSGSTPILHWSDANSRWSFVETQIRSMTSIVRGTTANELIVSGGSTTALGANIIAYAESHATNAGDIVFRNDSNNVLAYDADQNVWQFQGKDIGTVNSISRGTSTSFMTLSGGLAGNTGANIQMFGESHPSQAYDIIFRHDTIKVLQYDHNEGVWDFLTKDIATNGIIKGKADTTANRPSASTAGAGASMFDTNLGKPIWSDGSQWVDATGAAV